MVLEHRQRTGGIGGGGAELRKGERKRIGKAESWSAAESDNDGALLPCGAAGKFTTLAHSQGCTSPKPGKYDRLLVISDLQSSLGWINHCFANGTTCWRFLAQVGPSVRYLAGHQANCRACHRRSAHVSFTVCKQGGIRLKTRRALNNTLVAFA